MDSPYFDGAYFDSTYFDSDAATSGGGGRNKHGKPRRPPAPPVRVIEVKDDEDWLVLIL